MTATRLLGKVSRALGNSYHDNWGVCQENKKANTIILSTRFLSPRLAYASATIRNKVQHETLKSLADNMENILQKSRSQNTIKKYQCYFNKWSNWCQLFTEVSAIPAQSSHVLLFMVSLIQSDESFSVIESVFYAIKHFHNLGGLPDPTEAVLVSYVLDAAQRICHRPKKKKQPIVIEHIKKIHDSLTEKGMSLLHLRNFVMMLLCFTGFLRYDEAANLKLEDIVFQDSFMKIFIEKSKTDQFREGAWVFIAKVDSDICPTKILRKYITEANLVNPNDYLFRAMTYFKSKNMHFLRKKNTPISYSTMRSTLLSYLKDLGLEEKLFGMHSLRRGGATSAANNGVNDRLFQKHGRWKSVGAKDGYVEDNLNSLLFVSRSLGFEQSFLR